MLGTWLAWLFTIGMTGLGVSACAAPRPTSALYGVPQHDVAGWAWVRAAGLRDLGLAGMLAWFLLQGAHDAAAVVSIGTGIVAITDFTNVVSLRGLKPLLSLGVHLSGIALGILAGILLLAGI